VIAAPVCLVTGRERSDALGCKTLVDAKFANGRTVTVRAADGAGTGAGEVKKFKALLRIDTPRALIKGWQKAPAISRGMSTAAQFSSAHAAGEGSVDRGSLESFPASVPPAY
jgi:hypothetical protein